MINRNRKLNRAVVLVAVFAGVAGGIHANAAPQAQTTGGIKINVATNWQGVTPNNRQRFQVCLTGASYASPNCKTAPARGGALAWNGVQPGAYTIAQTNPGAAWFAAPYSPTVDVQAGQVIELSIANTFVDQFSCPLLDDFERQAASLNPQWTGDTTDYLLGGGAVSLADNGLAYWDVTPSFGSDQTVCVTARAFSGSAVRHALVLKGQAVWEPDKGVIVINYDHKAGRIDVQSQQPGQTELVTRATFATVLSPEDQLGARALRDGTVRVYRNGALLGATKPIPFFARRGGRIGMWYDRAAGATLDNFGGATLAP